MPNYAGADLKHKKVLITGGTTGIGRATAVLLATYEAKMLIFGRHERELNDALNDIKQAGGDVIGITADQADKEGVTKVFETVDKELGGIDILINNAALGGGNLIEEDYDRWKYTLDTNIAGYLACAKQAVKRMEIQGSGHVVNVGSLSAEEREAGSEVYVATKAAIQAFSESLRKAVNDKGIKVTLIEPGAVGTDMQPQKPDKQLKMAEDMKMLLAEDIADAILYTLTRPDRTDIISLQIRPHLQII